MPEIDRTYHDQLLTLKQITRYDGYTEVPSGRFPLVQVAVFHTNPHPETGRGRFAAYAIANGFTLNKINYFSARLALENYDPPHAHWGFGSIHGTRADLGEIPGRGEQQIMDELRRCIMVYLDDHPDWEYEARKRGLAGEIASLDDDIDRLERKKVKFVTLLLALEEAHGRQEP